MAAELKKDFDVDATLIPKVGGIFDVHLDGALIFSKLGDDGHFPEPGEVTSIVQKR